MLQEPHSVRFHIEPGLGYVFPEFIFLLEQSELRTLSQIYTIFYEAHFAAREQLRKQYLPSASCASCLEGFFHFTIYEIL